MSELNEQLMGVQEHARIMEDERDAATRRADRALLAMRKFAELEECLVWVRNERERAAATYHDLNYYVWLSEIVDCYRGARGRVLAAFRSGDVEAALKAMGEEDDR